ncbi:MAG TPA: MEDS domain-containing protein, partial [Chloroflexota bacterium]
MLHRAEGTLEDDGLAVETLDYQLAHLHPGAHVCPIYTTPAEQMRVLAAFSRGALIHHERLVLIVDQISFERIFAALEERGLDLAAARDQGGVVVIDDRQHLLRDGRLDADVFLHMHRGLSDEARQQGYAGLRVACDANWMFGEPFDRAALLDLEVRLNHPDQTGGATILCQYDRYATPPQILHDVLRTHPLAVVGEHLHDNLYYDPIDPTDDSRATEQRRVEWMLSRLESLTRRQYALVDLGRIALAGPAQIDLLLSAAALVAAEVRVDYVEIVEFLPTGNEIRRLVGLGLPGASSGTVEQIEVNGPLASSALRAGQPLIVTDWDAETRFEEPTLLREAAVHSTVSVLI